MNKNSNVLTVIFSVAFNVSVYMIHRCQVWSPPCAALSGHGRPVQLRRAHGQTERTDLWGCGARDRLQVHEGGPAVPGDPHGQEEGGVQLVPRAQDLLRHDPEAAVHGAVQVRRRSSQCEPSEQEVSSVITRFVQSNEKPGKSLGFLKLLFPGLVKVLEKIFWKQTFWKSPWNVLYSHVYSYWVWNDSYVFKRKTVKI